MAKPEQVTGPHNRTKVAIAEEKDVLERNRYIEKQRRSQTFKIICGPAKLGRILTGMENEPSRATLRDLQIPTEAYYAAVIAYMYNYIWQIEDFPPSIDAKLWEMMSGRAAEYFQAVEIRGNAISTGGELKENFLT